MFDTLSLDDGDFVVVWNTVPLLNRIPDHPLEVITHNGDEHTIKLLTREDAVKLMNFLQSVLK